MCWCHESESPDENSSLENPIGVYSYTSMISISVLRHVTTTVGGVWRGFRLENGRCMWEEHWGHQIYEDSSRPSLDNTKNILTSIKSPLRAPAYKTNTRPFQRWLAKALLPKNWKLNNHPTWHQHQINSRVSWSTPRRNGATSRRRRYDSSIP